MLKTLFLCLTLCAALGAQPRLPKRGAPASPSDLESSKGKSQATPQMKQQLAADLTAATADKNLSSREIAQLSSDLYKALNGAGISAAEFNAAVSDAQTLLKASGVSSSDAEPIASDLKAIGAEVQKTALGAQPGDVHRKSGRK